MLWLSLLSFLCAAGPAALIFRNLTLLRPPPQKPKASAGTAALIPARDEERNIAGAIEAALASDATEIIVLDDGSSDRTAEIVRQLPARLLEGAPLPGGWRGKNFACAQLAEAASQPVLIFAALPDFARTCLTRRRAQPAACIAATPKSGAAS